MNQFEKIIDGIYRLCIPFENIYTTVFLLVHENHIILVDNASSKEDVTQYILPALEKMDVEPTMLVCSHMHGDHAGGLDALKEIFPDVLVGILSKEEKYRGKSYYHFEDGEFLTERYIVYNLQGHCEDSMGIYDCRNRILLSFDSLQMYGVGNYGICVRNYKKYQETVERIRSLQPNVIISSHEYVPYGYYVEGTKAVELFLDKCIEAINLVSDLVKKNEYLENNQLKKMYHQIYLDLPPIEEFVIEGAREEWRVQS